VKYTCSRDYTARGLHELLEYMALARDGNYLEPYARILGPESQVRGCLFTDQLESPLITETGTVRYLMHGRRRTEPDRPGHTVSRTFQKPLLFVSTLRSPFTVTERGDRW